MAISKDEVKYIAQLAKLHFDEDEAEKFYNQNNNEINNLINNDDLPF